MRSARRFRTAVFLLGVVLLPGLVPGCAAAPDEPSATAPGQAASPIAAIQVQVTEVVDGDTIRVRLPDGGTTRVRFIGVDTPENTTEVEPYGAEASAYTARELAGRTLYLETDAEEYDRYGRLLAHVWLDLPTLVSDAEIREHLFNAHLVLAGYANLMTVPPNVKYVDYLTVYQAEAREAKTGLWAAEPAR